MDSNEPLLILSEAPKIYKPKPKRLLITSINVSNWNHVKINGHPCKTPVTKTKYLNNLCKNHHDKNTAKSNLVKKNNEKEDKFDFDLISFEEIEKDFNNFKARSEILKVEKELISLMRRNSTKDSLDEDDNKNIERAKNPFFNNYDEME